MIKKFITICLLLLACEYQLCAQVKDNIKAQEYLEAQEQYKKSMLLREYDSALVLMDEQRYQQAEVKFRYVLDNIKSVPSDLTYHFGRNSFHLAKYKQSIDWLNKYIQLKGTNGQFYTQAVEWKKKAEEEFLKERTKETKKVEQVFSTDYDIDCGPTGKVTCPVCKGDHVIIKKGAFGNEYKTCGYCNEHGVLTCDEYNKLLRGELKPKG
jgi:tetratricopeptide (TPR) repeat protein